MGGITQTPAIRQKCMDCSCDSYAEVRGCEIKDCPLYPGRLGKRPKGFRPLKAIREYCKQCMNGSRSLVQECDNLECSLHSFRFGMGESTRLKRMETKGRM